MTGDSALLYSNVEALLLTPASGYPAILGHKYIFQLLIKSRLSMSMAAPSGLMSSTPEDLAEILSLIQTKINDNISVTTPPLPVLPPPEALKTAASSLRTSLHPIGTGTENLVSHLLTDVFPALNAQSTSPHYYGFVTGGVTPAALLADIIVTLADQNVQMHLPTDTISTKIEDAALNMLLELFHLDTSQWRGRIFTTGATASNILGLACGREYLLKEKLKLAGYTEVDASVGELGILGACVEAGVMGIQILSAAPHSSVTKAASVVGIGRKNVYNLSWSDAPWEFDLEELEERLETGQEKGIVSIVVVGFGEVNTGRFTTNLREIRELVTKYGGWLHIDAAFGIFARALTGLEGEMGEIAKWADGLELADSITGDGHKLLNVPYDCGFFFTHTSSLLQSTFLNAAPYLAAPPSISTVTIPSPLNIGIENSRRFRALPVYATLSAYGTAGYVDLLTRLVTHARGIARYIYKHPAYELLPVSEENEEDAVVAKVFMVVLFRAREERVNIVLKDMINASKRMYVSGTMWDGREAVRIAVGNWRVGLGGEAGGRAVVEEVLESVLKNE